MQDLGTFGGSNSSAAGINSGGDFVGYADIASGASHAFLYDNGHMMDLNGMVDSSAAGWVLSSAGDINDSGWIAGEGVTPTGFTHAFLLTPTPEPSSVVILGMGILALSARRKRRES